ncbi:MAG: hypothetical protein ACLUJG_10885 [Lawsonibacter sp.]
MLAQLPPEGELPDVPTLPPVPAAHEGPHPPGLTARAGPAPPLRCARQAAVILLVCGTPAFSGLMVTSQAFPDQSHRGHHPGVPGVHRVPLLRPGGGTARRAGTSP